MDLRGLAYLILSNNCLHYAVSLRNTSSVYVFLLHQILLIAETEQYPKKQRLNTVQYIHMLRKILIRAGS